MDVILEALSRNVEQLLGRSSGPLNFRLVMMPIVVTVLAVRAHLRDVREGKPIFLGAFVTSPTERRRLFRSGLKDFGKVFVVACVLDTTYQIMVLRTFRPLQMLIVAVVCAIAPYFLIRGPVTRLVYYLQQRRRGAVEPTAARMKPDSDDHERDE